MRIARVVSAWSLMSCTTVQAQQKPTVRPIGPITRVSTEPMGSANTAVAMSDGRVFVNDVVSRRVLLFDSTLATAKIAADSTSVTAKAYGARPGFLSRYRGDTALFVDPATASMPVLGPAGTIVRVLARPMIGGRFPLPIGNGQYPPGVDAHGRIVGTVPTLISIPDFPPGKASVQRTIVDSSLIIRFDLDTRLVDTVASFKTVKINQAVARDEDGNMTSLTVTPDVLPVIDDWTTLPNGTIAIVRGRDYHVDWLDANGAWRSTPKMSFDWQHLGDDQKTALIDSALAALKARRDSIDAILAARGSVAPSGGEGRGGRGREGGPPGGPPPTLIDGRPALSDLPDYRPPFTRGSTTADGDGNLWIRTTTMLKGQPVYDIVNSRGEIVDRVQLPPFRTVAGFGPGVVYMAVKDSAGVVHLERARIK